MVSCGINIIYPIYFDPLARLYFCLRSRAQQPAAAFVPVFHVHDGQTRKFHQNSQVFLGTGDIKSAFLAWSVHLKAVSLTVHRPVFLEH